IFKIAARLLEAIQQTSEPRQSSGGNGIAQMKRVLRDLDAVRAVAVEQLKQVRYFWKQARWLTERFPEAKLCDVQGLVKLVDKAEIEANDWSLTPGRYVGVAPEDEDENFDFEGTMREIHVELEDLNAEAVRLAAVIRKNFEELGV
ncbi:MAG: hypothetical protein Q7I97_03570, partial [Thermovirgaceae bacterium]|nr:hypothetical protein [Thermovirgaceae bacterium]